MNVLSAVATAAAPIISAAGDTYGPAEMTTDLATGVTVILPYVGAGVGGGVVLMLTFLGIRKGFGFFRGLAGK